MTLPTYDEMMIQTVTGWIAAVSEQLATGRPWIEATLRDRLRQGLTERRKVIDAAERGCELSHAVLAAEFHKMLDLSQMPPASVRSYMARVDKHPKRGRGRSWWDDWRRNLVFVTLIGATAVEFNLRPTRNKSTDPLPAAGIVAEALRRAGFRRGTSESRLANLWAARPYPMGEVVALLSSGTRELLVQNQSLQRG
jgi:hypothetical protein